MKLMSVLMTAVIFLIFTQVGNGSYVVEISIHSYSNPTGRCAECQPGETAGCCDESFVRPASQSCPDISACDPIIRHCVSTADGTECDAFSFFDANASSINFDQTIHRLDNRVVVLGNEPWHGIRLFLDPRDCSVSEDNTCGPSQPIDSVHIDIDSAPGTNSSVMTYSGSIVQFRVSFSVRCAEGFGGTTCQESCAMLACTNGICVARRNGFVCLCDFGYTGTSCEREISSADNADSHLGTIIGAVVGSVVSLIVMFLSICLPFCCVWMAVRNTENRAAPPSYTDTQSVPPPPQYYVVNQDQVYLGKN